MKKIKTEEVVDGMVVGKLIEDRLGRAILKPGDQLKASFTSRLVKWGIEEIWIEGGVEDKSASGKSAEKSQEDIAVSANNIVNQMFQHFDEDSHMNLVKKITQHYLSDPRLKSHLR